MNILLFGASGNVGKHVLAEALRRGHTVTAFVHRTELPEQTGLRVVRGDIYDRSRVEAAIPGHDAILSTLSSWRSKDKNVLSTAMQVVIPAAEANGLRRLVSLSGNVAHAPGDKDSPYMHIIRAAFTVVGAKVLRDAEDHISLLADSKLDWTVVRASIMTAGATDSYNLSKTGASFLIQRPAIAKAMVDLAENGTWLHEAPFIRQV